MPRGPVRSFGTSSAAWSGSANGNIGFLSPITNALHAALSGDKVSVAVWVKPMTRRSAIFNKRAGSGGSFRCFTLEHGTTTSPVRFGVQNESGSFISATAASLDATPLGVWTHVCGTYDGAFVRLYLNGVKVAESAQSGIIRQDNNQIMIGAFASGSTAYGGYLHDFGLWNIALTSEQVTHLYGQGHFPVEGLQMRLAMDDGSGTVVTDTSGFERSGNLSGGFWVSDVPSAPRSVPAKRVTLRQFRSSALFNGVNAKVINTTAITNVLTSFSAAVWFKQPASETANRLILRAGDGSAQRIGIITNQQQVKAGFYNGATYTSRSGFFRIGEWNHLVYTWDGATSRLWINGVEQSGVTGPISGATNGLVVGDQSGAFYLGTLADLRVWNRSLTPAEALETYGSGRNITHGLHLAWPLDEGAGTAVMDTSDGKRNGTVSGVWAYSRDVPLKPRKALDGNLVENGDVEFVPPFTAPATTSGRYIDGTAAGSASNDLFAWKHHAGGNGGNTMFDTLMTYEGQPSIKLTAGPGGYCEVRGLYGGYYGKNQPIELQPNTQYTLSGVIKTLVRSGSSSGGAYLNISMSNGAGGASASPAGVSTPVAPDYVRTTQDWMPYAITFTTGSNCVGGHVELRLYCHIGDALLDMDAWFATVRVKPVTPSARAAA